MKHSAIRLSAVSAVVMMAVASCSYYTYPLSIERRSPSKLGVDLSGRSISVSFVHQDPKDSVFHSRMAEGFASGLEELYFKGEEGIDIFALKREEGGMYSSKDTLMQLVMSTDADLVFLMDSNTYVNHQDTGDTLQVKVNLYAYDSMDKRDSVRAFYGKRSYKAGDPEFPTQLGGLLAKPFESTWTTETYQIYFYDESSWIDAATQAANYEWAKALNSWAEILSSTRNMQRRACASYNIAFACYMLEDYAHALQWLDRAEKDGEVAQANSLRHHIAERTQQK